MLLSGSNVAAMFTNGGSTVGVYMATTLWSIPMAHIWGIQLWRFSRESPNPSAFLHRRKRSSFPAFVLYSDMVNFDSLVGIKPGKSEVVIGYQVDEFTHTWLVEHFVAPSHIYSGFMGKV